MYVMQVYTDCNYCTVIPRVKVLCQTAHDTISPRLTSQMPNTYKQKNKQKKTTQMTIRNLVHTQYKQDRLQHLSAAAIQWEKTALKVLSINKVCTEQAHYVNFSKSTLW